MELRNQIFVQAYDWLRQNRRVGNQSDLAQKIGVGTNTVSNIMRGKNRVSDKTLQQLNAAFDNCFNMNWLRGEDSEHMLVADLDKSESEKYNNPGTNNDEIVKIALEAKNEIIESLKREIVAKDEIIIMLKDRLRNKGDRYDNNYIVSET